MHSPVRSESDAFRGVVIVVAGAVLVAILAAPPMRPGERSPPRC